MEAGDLEAVAAVLEAREGASPVLVAPVARPGGTAFVCALPPAPGGEGLRWLVVDGRGAPLRARRDVRAYVELVAMCETAEESAAALSAGEARPHLERAHEAARRLGEAPAEIAAEAMLEALLGIETSAGVRVADGPYMDRVAAAAGLVGDRFDLLKEAAVGITARLAGTPLEPLEPLAEELWAALRVLARDGAPDRFPEIMQAAMGAASALADDVLGRYAVALDDEEDG